MYLFPCILQSSFYVFQREPKNKEEVKLDNLARAQPEILFDLEYINNKKLPKLKKTNSNK